MKKKSAAQYSAQHLQKINRLTVIIETIIGTFLLVGYLNDAAHGNISMLFGATVAVLAAITIIVNMVIYCLNKQSDILRHFVVCCYAVVYLIIMIGAKNDLVFIVALPVMSVLMLYFDYAFILRTSIGVYLINLGCVIRYMVNGKMSSGLPCDTSTVLLQMAGLGLILVALCEVTRLSNQINSDKMETINRQKMSSDHLLGDVLQIANVIQESSAQVGDKLSALQSATDKTASALQEITEGNSSNADSIEKQTEMTTNIQSKITDARTLSESMMTYAKESLDSVREGQHSINELQHQAQEIEESNKQVSDLMKMLDDNAQEVGNITEQIFSISSQTNMLALNASIESARAGEAGRGFAVVAEQIRILAEETRVLTENIQDIVKTLQDNTKQTRESLEQVLDISAREKGNIENVGGRFEDIDTKVSTLSANVQNISESIDHIYQMNNEIVDSISQISAVSEEVAASTLEANDVGMASKIEADEMSAIMQHLLEESGKLDQYM